MPARKTPTPRNWGKTDARPAAAAPERADSPPAPATARISPARLRAYALLSATVVPVLFFLLLEGGLRLFGYGYPSSFFLRRNVDGRPVYVQNDRYTLRFFPPVLVRAPNVLSMPAAKPEGTFRIFVFGESAAQGDPDPAFGFSRILGVMLKERYPGRKFEVVNTGITAINSNVFLPLARECAGHQPDLFLVYAGNNEVIGPYGPGTVFAPFLRSLPTIRAAVAFKGTKTGQLLENAVGRFGTARGAPKGWGGMEMFLNAQVAADDPRMAGVYDHFRRNVTDVAAAARRAGARTLLCTAPVNLKDGGPFASRHERGLSPARMKEWDARFTEGARLQAAGRYADALESYALAEKIDGGYADLVYRMGRCEWGLGRYGAAKESLARARDLDTLRFRADSRLNAIVRELAKTDAEGDVYLADTEAALADAGPHGLPGREALWEHVHLNFHGNYLFARTALGSVERILTEGTPKPAAPTGVVPTEEECAAKLAYTDWNRFMTASEVAARFDAAPFTNESDHDTLLADARKDVERYRPGAGPEGVKRADAAYRAAIEGDGADWMLKDEYGKFLLATGNPSGAERQFAAVLERVPNSTPARAKLGEALAGQEKTAEALGAFREALKDAPDRPSLLVGMGNALYDDGQKEEAVRLFDRAKELDPLSPLPYLSLGDALAEEGEIEGAVREYEGALKANPRIGEAHRKLGGLYARKNGLDRAVREFEEASRLDPGNADTYADLGKLYFAAKNDRAALRNFAKSLQLNPKQPDVEKRLADAYFRSGQVTAALAHLERSLTLAPATPEAESNVAVLMARTGQMARAMPHFRAAVEREPGNAQYRYNLAVALMKLGRTGEAVKELTAASNAMPGNPQIRRSLEAAKRMSRNSGGG